MKLKNKKTGAIYNIEDIDLGNNKDGIWLGLTRYTSLAELCKDWEDFEEDKRYWYIDSDGEVMSKELAWFTQYQDDVGNRFETEEEAEKAVEKLKAWKRLKDKCCISFSGLNRNIKGRPVSVNLDFNIEGRTTFDEAIQNTKDLMLLFGGDDESSN